MGCDIHSNAERKTESGFEKISGLEPFGWRSYGMFGFLANVRNYSDVPPIAERRGVPEDMSPEVAKDYEGWGMGAHGASWLSVEELAAFNYDAKMEDRRVTRQTGPSSWNGGCTAEPGGGKETTFREFLREGFFADIQKLKDAGADRIVFWFNS